MKHAKTIIPGEPGIRYGIAKLHIPWKKGKIVYCPGAGRYRKK